MPKQKRRRNVCRRLEKLEKKQIETQEMLHEIVRMNKSTSKELEDAVVSIKRIADSLDKRYESMPDSNRFHLAIEKYIEEQEKMKEGQQEEDLTEEEEARIKEQEESVQQKECACPICRPDLYTKAPVLKIAYSTPNLISTEDALKIFAEIGRLTSSTMENRIQKARRTADRE